MLRATPCEDPPPTPCRRDRLASCALGRRAPAGQTPGGVVARRAPNAAMQKTPNILAGPYLERAAHWRKDEARVLAALEDAGALFVPVWRMRNVIAWRRDEARAYFVHGRSGLLERITGDYILLGEFHGRACFAVELAGDAPPEFEPGCQFQDLRLIAGDLPQEEAGVLAYARAMLQWRERRRFCGRCGAPTTALQAGHVLRCSDPGCAFDEFPRIDPAVIVLVTDGQRALLGRQSSWPPGRYSTIAGFVEPGESLEDAVVREVREETGVEVGAVDYHSSQPWPFPSSLMLGFSARAVRTDISRQDGELEDAQWFTRQQIAAGAAALPTTHSISFRLIEDWYDAGARTPLRCEPNVRMWGQKRIAG